MRLARLPGSVGIVLSLWLLFASLEAAELPDLVVNRYRLAHSAEVQFRDFPAEDCAVVEGCVRAPGRRKLLLFDVGIGNLGPGDLVLGDPAASTNLYALSACHGHFHLSSFTTFTLLTTNGSLVLRARKQGFCLRDDRPYGHHNRPAKGYDCANQGLTAGWQDIYDKSLDCQWLDITGVRPGRYLLRVTVNPRRLLTERNYGNNSVTVPVIVPRFN